MGDLGFTPEQVAYYAAQGNAGWWTLEWIRAPKKYREGDPEGRFWISLDARIDETREARRKTAAALPDTIDGEPVVYVKEPSGRGLDDLKRAGLPLSKDNYFGSFTSPGVYVVKQSEWDRMISSLSGGRFRRENAEKLRYRRKPSGEYTTMGRAFGR